MQFLAESRLSIQLTVQPKDKFTDFFLYCQELNILAHGYTIETVMIEFQRFLEANYRLTKQRAAEGTLNSQLHAHWEIYKKMFGENS